MPFLAKPWTLALQGLRSTTPSCAAGVSIKPVDLQRLSRLVKPPLYLFTQNKTKLTRKHTIELNAVQ